MTAPARYTVGDVRLTRVPYFDVGLDPEGVRLTDDLVAREQWAATASTGAEGQVLVGQVVWVIESEGQVIVVDPCGASDGFLRTGPEAIGHGTVMAAMTDAGFPPEVVDVVVLSHLDGIGMTAVVDPDGRWGPAFPAARIVITTSKLDPHAAATTSAGWRPSSLLDQGAVDGVAGDHQVTSEISLRHTGAHTPGHAVVEVRWVGNGRRSSGTSRSRPCRWPPDRWPVPTTTRRPPIVPCTRWSSSPARRAGCSSGRCGPIPVPDGPPRAAPGASRPRAASAGRVTPSCSAAYPFIRL